MSIGTQKTGVCLITDRLNMSVQTHPIIQIDHRETALYDQLRGLCNCSRRNATGGAILDEQMLQRLDLPLGDICILDPSPVFSVLGDNSNQKQREPSSSCL
jgi:hypothetical protein